jgi:hypothetical protein
LAALLVAHPAAGLTQPVFGTVNNQLQQIGQMDSSVNNRVEEAKFQLDNAYKYLMDDSKNSQFRYFQIVTNDPDPINYLGQPNVAPYTDPPKDGWDYQRTPANNVNGLPGADASPFYENDDVVGAFAYPKYSGQFNNFGGAGPFPVHSEANGYVLTQDVPGYGDNSMVNTSLDFYTFIVFINPDLKAAKEFIVLGGYQWGVGRNNAGNYFDIDPTTLDLSTDDLRGKVSLALGADGFGDWTALYGGNLVVPEPGCFAVVVLCVVFPMRRRRAA